VVSSAPIPLFVGRYAIFDRIAVGGMAAVHLARMMGPGGFARTVAAKRMHAQFALDPEFVSMFLDEARLASRIRHPHVVQTLDIVNEQSELFIVMEYIEGEALSTLLRAAREAERPVPLTIVAAVACQFLMGLQAAHDARSDHGEPLQIVHRDVSPQNILIGADGIARVLDFGIAKALGKLHTTREGQLKGKLAYLSPEQVLGHPVTRRTDVFAAAIVLWEAIAGKRLFAAENEGEVLKRILEGKIAPPSSHRDGTATALDAVVLQGLSRDPVDRFDSAVAFAEAIERATPVASPRDVAQWMAELARKELLDRASLVSQIEGHLLTPSRTELPLPPHRPNTGSDRTIPSGDGPRASVKRARWRQAALGLSLAALTAGVAFAASHAPNSSRSVGPPESFASLVPRAAVAPLDPPALDPLAPPVAAVALPSAAASASSNSEPSKRRPPRKQPSTAHDHLPAPAPAGTSLYSRE
jgi:serine/threonine-protein kinase